MSQVDDSKVVEFLKRQILVKNWIEEVLKVRLNDDLISSLKNGIVVCYLMIEIEHGSIPAIQVCYIIHFSGNIEIVKK